MTLTASASQYIRSNPCSPLYARQIRSRCQRFVSWLGADPETDSLVADPTPLSDFLIALEASQLKPLTIRGYRACLVAVVNSHSPARSVGSSVRRCRRLSSVPRCWSAEELRQLFAAAKRLRDSGVAPYRRSLWWSLLLQVGYSSGQRLGDLLACHCDDLDSHGNWTLTQSKTGKRVSVRVSEEALRLNRQLGPRELLLPWPYSIESLRKHFKKLLIASGVSRGSLKWLRRSAGSHFERLNPGGGHRLLGNSREIFETFYLDPSIVSSTPLTAPPL